MVRSSIESTGSIEAPRVSKIVTLCSELWISSTTTFIVTRGSSLQEYEVIPRQDRSMLQTQLSYTPTQNKLLGGRSAENFQVVASSRKYSLPFVIRRAFNARSNCIRSAPNTRRWAFCLTRSLYPVSRLTLKIHMPVNCYSGSLVEKKRFGTEVKVT